MGVESIIQSETTVTRPGAVPCAGSVKEMPPISLKMDEQAEWHWRSDAIFSMHTGGAWAAFVKGKPKPNGDAPISQRC
jgi:hypothetical protein